MARITTKGLKKAKDRRKVLPLKALDSAAGIGNTSSNLFNYTGYKQAYQPFFLYNRDLIHTYYTGKRSSEKAHYFLKSYSSHKKETHSL